MEYLIVFVLTMIFAVLIFISSQLADIHKLIQGEGYPSIHSKEWWAEAKKKEQ
jgi:hypothetical protein